MLDYTILTNNKKDFIKDITNFNLRESIEEIQEIFQDKIFMKKIRIKIDLEEIIIRTDKKRF